MWKKISKKILLYFILFAFSGYSMAAIPNGKVEIGTGKELMAKIKNIHPKNKNPSFRNLNKNYYKNYVRHPIGPQKFR